jgi:hypothetical protein
MMKRTKRMAIAAASLAALLCPQAAAGQAKAPAKAPAKTQSKAPAPRQSASAPVTRRDPFKPLVDPKAASTQRDLEPIGPGLHNLPVNAARIDGIVRGPNGMIVVISTPQQRVYFAREGAKLLDGSIERISMDAVIFRQLGKDPFGKTVEQRITKYLYPSAGE